MHLEKAVICENTVSQIGLTTEPKRKNLPFTPSKLLPLNQGHFSHLRSIPGATRKPFDWKNLAITPVK